MRTFGPLVQLRAQCYHQRMAAQNPAMGKAKRQANVPLWSALLVTVLTSGLLLAHRTGQLNMPGLEEAELATVDARFQLRGPRRTLDDQIVIVGFDDRLRQTAPEVFQQRAGWAKFLTALQQYQPKLVGLDAFFATPELPLPESVTRAVNQALTELTPSEIARSLAVQHAHEALQAVQKATQGDAVLAHALKNSGNVLLPLLFFLDHGEDSPLTPGQTERPGQPEPPGLKGARVNESVLVERDRGQRPPRAEMPVYAALPQLAEVALGAGAVNVLRDTDGKVRRVFAVIEHGGRYYQAMGLALASRAQPGLGTTYVTGAPTLGLGPHPLPLDPRGVAILDFLGPEGAFPYISAADVLSGQVTPQQLAQKIVLVGYTDAARDRVATPYDTAVPGVEIHATLLHNALHEELLRRAPGWLSALGVLLLGLLLTAAQIRRVRQQRAWLPGLAAALLSLGWLLAAYLLFRQRILIDVAGPLGAIVLTALAAVSTALATEGREKAHLRTAFSRYVSGSLVEKILEDPSRVRLGGERRDLTVLFSDIRGFSRFSEQMEPEALSAFLNEYLTPMTQIVLDHGGMLDKYIGDAVMAVYGAPLELPQHVTAACQSALEMQEKLAKLREEWAARGLPRVEIGVGINCGLMSVGNMGSTMRFDYTVMGDAVNLAARLEALTKELGCRILCGPHVPEMADKSLVFRELDRVRVKGRDGALAVHELVGTLGNSPLDASALAMYAQGLAAYRQRNWREARTVFATFLSLHPDDGPAQKMLGRLEELEKQPLEHEWDGVYEQHSK